MTIMTDLWADQPFALIPVKSQKSRAPETDFIAQDMAAAHNNLLRALNSVYNQAPYVEKEEDKRDLLTYTSFWVDWIEREQQLSLFPTRGTRQQDYLPTCPVLTPGH